MPGKSKGVRAILDAVGHGREDVVVDPPEPDPCQEVRTELEAVKAKLEEAEDVIATEVGRIGRAAANLRDYVPVPNEED